MDHPQESAGRDQREEAGQVGALFDRGSRPAAGGRSAVDEVAPGPLCANAAQMLPAMIVSYAALGALASLYLFVDPTVGLFAAVIPAVSAGSLLALLIMLRRRPVSASRTNIVALFVLGMATATFLYCARQSDSASISFSLFLTVTSFGLVFSSMGWLILSLVIVAAGWLGVAFIARPGGTWGEYGVGIVAAAVLACVIHFARRRPWRCLEEGSRQPGFGAPQPGNLEREQTLEAMLESASEGIVIVRQGGRIALVNTRTEDMFGYTREELIGQPVELLVPDGAREAHSAQCDDYFDQPRVRRMGAGPDLVGRRKDGSALPVEISLSYVSTSEGMFTLSFVSDISERRRAEEERLLLIQELDAFAHTVAHDLKSPLSLIHGYGELLETERDLSSTERGQAIDGIMRGATRMEGIINALLLLATVRSEKRVELSELDMGAAVAAAQEKVEADLAEYEARVSHPPEWPLAVGYAPWVEQVWANLLSNAAKYGGRPPVITLGWDVMQGGKVRFWVEDNGPGLTSEEESRLFVPFTRLHQGVADGHGLGLSIVDRMVRRMGGEVGVVGNPTGQKGCRFFFVLPASFPLAHLRRS